MNEKETVITKAKSPENYEKIMFCMKAMGGRQDRPFTRYMHIENARTGSRLVCTDGKRLHAATISVRIPAGNYQPEVKDDCVHFKNPVGIAFPAWKNVLPEDAVFKGTANLEKIDGTKAEREEKFSVAYGSFLFATGFKVNMGFLRDAIGSKWKIFTQGGNKSLVKLEKDDDKNLFAVFAPLAA